VGKEGGIPTCAGVQVGQLVGYLAVEELHSAAAGQRELAPLAAIDEPAALDQRAVLGLHLNGVHGGHCIEDSPGRPGVRGAAPAVGAAGLSRLPGPPDRLREMALAEHFQQIVDSLPDDWTDLELDLRLADESRYVDAAVYLATCNAKPYSKHDWHWRLLVAHRFGHAAAAPTVHGTLRLLDDAGIEGELVLREQRSGRVEVTQMWGRPHSVRDEFARLRAQ
jgi:hypothetical protein